MSTVEKEAKKTPKPRVVVAEPITDAGLQLLMRHCDVDVAGGVDGPICCAGSRTPRL